MTCSGPSTRSKGDMSKSDREKADLIEKARQDEQDLGRPAAGAKKPPRSGPKAFRDLVAKFRRWSMPASCRSRCATA